MPTSDPTEILLQHNLWANRQFLDTAAALTPEQFHQKFPIGPGSVHDTITHLLAATRAWGDLLAGREMRPRLEGTSRTIPELRALLEEISADMDASIHAHPHEELLTRVREGKSYTFTRGAILTHVCTHAMHHRAQLLNMFRRLNINPLPPSSTIEWTWLADKN